MSRGTAGSGWGAPHPLIDLNPIDDIGGLIQDGLADMWTSAMLALWSAGLWAMKSIMQLLDRFLTPDVTDPGLSQLYGVTLGLSVLVALVIAFGQIGLAVVRRDGSNLGSLLVGLVQYGAVVVGWVAVCAGLIVASAGLTSGLLETLLGIEDFSGYETAAGWPERIGGTVGATVLALCSLFLLIPAAFGYVLIMLVREASLLILVATMPIAAAGALGDGTRAWMWKSLRWFVACVLIAPCLALVLGIGVQITRAAFPDGAVADPAAEDVIAGATGSGDVNWAELLESYGSAQESQLGMAVVGCVIMVLACFCPMVLFRLLAFVDPGTSSGAAFRANLAANGGVGGLLGRNGGSGAQGTSAAMQMGDDGRSGGEAGADAQTTDRWQGAPSGSRKGPGGFSVVGAVGAAAGTTIRGMGRVALTGASLLVDVNGQGGVGDGGYYDTSPAPRPTAARRASAPEGPSVPSPGSGVANDPPTPSSVAPGPAGASGAADAAGGVVIP
ncbi:hypothetical protein RDV89_17530 [Nocardioides zeae]|uniref:TrbL/VirB6 plasmid conjugal transfer protein n=1 Tax=Nocardioides imazamoxiresistens TaxID=3231893 RepID=A0ABU3Q0A2_9ACTN|nr:hypothetical protein [Nocardioides zeae]MDT9594894.1 hypothetical protein [Nocardioides zeae]